MKLHLWDVAGSQLTAQPCHHGLIGQGAEGVLYVMDVTSRESLQAVDDWDQALSKVRQNASTDFPIVACSSRYQGYQFFCFKLHAAVVDNISLLCF